MALWALSVEGVSAVDAGACLAIRGEILGSCAGFG